jgi:hypothetical protein
MMMTTVNASSSSRDLGKNAVEAATRNNQLIFSGYMVLLLLAAIATYLLWRSGNTVQGAIVADANARIAEANNAAAQANERTTSLEHDNLKLRDEQQKLQIELAKQQTAAAKAERALLDLQQRIKPRSISKEQENFFLDFTKSSRKGLLTVVGMDGDLESLAFAKQLSEMFSKAGWTITLTSEAEMGYTRSGVVLFVHSRDPMNILSPRFHTAALSTALRQMGILEFVNEDPGLGDGLAVLTVGHKA